MAVWAGNQRVTLDFLARALDEEVQPVRGDSIVADVDSYTVLALGADETYKGSDGTDLIFKRVQASHVDMAVIGTPTFTTVQHLQDIFHSAGWVSGGAVTDAGGGNIDVAAGTGLIRASASATAEIKYFDWPQSLTNAIPADTVRWVGIEYNAGTPQVVIKSSDSFDSHTDFLLDTVVNEGGTLHLQSTRHAVGDHASQMILRLFATMPKTRDEQAGGIILGESGTRNVTVTAGTLWEKLESFAIAALDTAVTGNFARYYRDGGGGFTKEAAQTQWPNTQYDDGSGTLVTMTNNRYANLWFYTELDSDLVMMYGRNQYTSSAGAEDESPPSSVPDRTTYHGKLIGRMIFQKSAATTVEIQSVFSTVFSASQASDHGNLGGLGDDDHPQYGQIAATETISALWTFNPLGTGGITDYDIAIGDTDGTPTYGIARLGDSIIGRTSYKTGSIDLDGTMIFRNVGGPVTGEIDFVFVESGGTSTRFALPKSGVGNATYNSRSMLIAGPAPADTDYVKVSYWQAQGIFHNILCDTDGDGADLGVQNDLEVEGDIFTDSILESTGAAGVTVDGVLLKDGLVDGVDIAARDHAKYTNAEAIAAVEGEATLVLGGAVSVLSGDLDIGARGILTTTHRIDEESASFLALRNRADTTYARLRLSNMQIRSTLGIELEGGDGTPIVGRQANDGYSIFKAWDTGVGAVEVARLAGAADPYFSMGGSQEFKFYNSGIVTFDGELTVNANIVVTGTVDGVDVAARDHAEAHAPESHTGQGATAAELETLTDGSDADSLHGHTLTAVYVLYGQHDDTLLHSAPGTTYTNFTHSAVGGTSRLAIDVVYDTIAWTHARLIAEAGANEAGSGKGLKVIVNGTDVEVTWDGAGNAQRDSGWVAITSPGGVVSELVEVKASSGTENMRIFRCSLLFKRDP